MPTCVCASIAADIRHLLSALRRFRGLRRFDDDGRTHSPTDGTDGADGVDDAPVHVVPPSSDHLRVLASGQAALESMENWMSRQYYGSTTAAAASALSSAALSSSAVAGDATKSVVDADDVDALLQEEVKKEEPFDRGGASDDAAE